MQRDIGHSSNTCFHVSRAPHRGHAEVVAIWRWCSTWPEGMECLASRHANTLIFEGTCNFHRLFHSPLSLFISDDSSLPSNQFSLLIFVDTSMRYADATVKIPLGVSLQAQKSSARLVHNGIFKISSASKGVNTALTSPSFHEVVVESISSDTFSGGAGTREVIGRLKLDLGIQL